MPSILLLNGPNLNLLGTREPALYGSDTLENINKRLSAFCQKNNIQFNAFQSNAEHELIEQVHQAASKGINFILLNPAAFTHTSVALRDALLGTELPFIEIHLSNIYAREEYRKKSYFSDIASGVICGLGPIGYELALQAAINKLKKT